MVAVGILHLVGFGATRLYVVVRSSAYCPKQGFFSSLLEARVETACFSDIASSLMPNRRRRKVDKNKAAFPTQQSVSFRGAASSSIRGFLLVILLSAQNRMIWIVGEEKWHLAAGLPRRRLSGEAAQPVLQTDERRTLVSLIER